MVKPNPSCSDRQNAANMVPQYKKFKMDLKIQKNKPFHYQQQSQSQSFGIEPTRLQQMNVSNINLNRHHLPIHNHPNYTNYGGVQSDDSYSTISSSSNGNNNINNIGNGEYVANPFNDPPSGCTQNDVRWIWRKLLEEKRGQIKNRKFYANYVGSKKSRKFYVIRTADPNGHKIESQKARLPPMYCGNHHLKHLVKIGCPKHDLYPILNELGYTINPSICTHKSFVCTTRH
eukprot:506379_1